MDALPILLRNVVAEATAAKVVDRTFAQLTTLRVGGAPRAVIACGDAQSLRDVVAAADASGADFVVVGGGSNLVVGEDVSDVIVVWATDVEFGEEVTSSSITLDAASGQVMAFAGVEMDALVRDCVDAGLGGLECLSGIPGSVGATPVQNVGAYGAEVSQVLRRVQLYDRGSGEWSWVLPEALELGYRYSNLKFTGRAVVTAVEFQLTTDGLSVPLRFGELSRALGLAEGAGGTGAGAGGGAGAPSAGDTSPLRAPVEEVREAVLRLRAGKGMVLDASDHDTWSAGSFFTNPVVVGVRARDAVVAAVAEQCGQDVADGMPLYEVTPRPAASGVGDASTGTSGQSDAAAGTSGQGDAAAGGSGSVHFGQGDAAAGGSASELSGDHAKSPDELREFKFSAAWLIERAGFPKGWHVPGNARAGLSTKHTLALTNRGDATSADIVELARAIRAGVLDRFGVLLEPEPIWLGCSIDPS